ncbi:MAG: hypothetical protein AAGF26_00410 [Cyanobacteria bacterium P01_G01_bin.49]
MTKPQKSSRNSLKAEYPDLYEKVSNILFRIDPIEINFECNIDEYEPEVDTILPRLQTCNSVEEVQIVVIEEFEKWFDKDTVSECDEKDFDQIAKEIWAILT